MSDKAIILAVDDTPELLALLLKILIPAGYDLRAVNSGELAMAAVAASPPDLILLDLRMKGMDGLEVCRRLQAREETRRIPIILISAFAGPRDWVEGLRLGASDFITKPFEVEDLLTRIKTHLALRASSVSLEQQAAEHRRTNEELQSEIVQRRRAEDELCQSLERAELAQHALLQQTESLERTNAELERFNRFAVGRELRMVELKQQINELCAQLGQPAPYVLPEEHALAKEIS